MASFPGQKAGASPVAPTTPSNLTATPLPSATQIFLQWNQSQDGDIAISYIISRCSGAACTNFTVVGTTVANAQNFTDNNLQLSTSYSYTLQAIDGAGNLSGVSNIATAVTPAVPLSVNQTQYPVNFANKWAYDTWGAQSSPVVGSFLANVLTPTIPGSFHATVISSTEIDLSWTASTEPNVPISFYTITISPGGLIAQIPAPTTVFNNTGLTASTLYSYTISATDVNGNTSGLASTSATTQAAVPPTVPGSFVATPVSSSEIDLSWTASVATGGTISFYTISISPGSVIVQLSAPVTSYHDVGLASSTAYSYTISATDSNGNTSGINSTSATTQAFSATLNFPRIAVVANGGDQSYGQGTTTGFTSYTASGPGTGAYTATQFLGSFDLVMPLGGSFEGFQAAGRTKQNLVQAIKGLGSFPNVKNASRTPFVFLYCIMESSQTGTGLPYQRFANLIASNNWWTYESAGGVGTIQPAGASGFFEVNYSYAWNTAVGSAARDASICGHVYGALSSGQGPAQSAATYFASALLTTNVLDSRFTGLTNGAASNADGLFLDNCFIFPNGGGNLSPASSSWDGLGLQSNAAIAAYPSGASTLLARGQQKFFATMQTYLASCNPGLTYYSIGNIGGYANTVGNGNIATVTANALASTLHGGIMEDTFGSGGNALQSFQTFAQVITNYNFGMDFCIAPKFFCLHARLPATDGSATATWRINGAATTVSTNTTQEYQCMRAAMCTALMDNGYFAIGTNGNIWNTTRYYDEFGDDSLAQVNVKRGYLGQPTSGTRPSAAFLNGVWGRKFTGGLVLVNPWLNGAQTITAAQLTTAFGGTYKRLSGTQQPAVNSGAAFTSYTFGDPDGLILLNNTVVNPTISTATPLPNATQGTVYGTQITATGGATPYVWSIDSDTPDTGAWLTINSSTGVLSGTPGTPETETVVVRVTGTDGGTSTKTFSLTVTSSSLTFLAAGHWQAAKMPLQIISPRPDSETGAFTGTVYARHRIWYYDGVNPIQGEHPIDIQGGAHPHVYQILAGPSWLSIGSSFGSPMYGVLFGTPNAAISKASPTTVTVRVWGQDQVNFIDVTFTICTSSSTADFVFADAVNGADTNTGAIGSKLKTLSKIMGATAATTTFPAARVYLATGTYQWPLQSDAVAPSGGYCSVDKNKIPIVYMTMPSSTVNIDASVAQLIDNGGGMTDCSFAGHSTSTFTITGSSATATDTHTFEIYNANRVSWYLVKFVNPINRANGSNTNSTSIYTANAGILKSYYSIWGCSETGRSGAAGNSMLMTSMFSVQNVCMKFCTISGQSGFGVFFKDSNQFVTAAYNNIQCTPEATNNGTALLAGCQHANLPAGSNNIEFCYNFVRGGGIVLDFQGFTPAGIQWEYRNTIADANTNFAAGMWNFGPAGTGPYSSENSVIVAHNNVYGSPTPLGGQAITKVGTEAQMAWSGTYPPANCPVNTTTGALVNSTTLWRNLYLFIRGWEIG